MKLVAIKNALTSNVGRQILHAQKHSPAVLFGIGVVGVVTATALACRATLKLDEVLERHAETMEQIDISVEDGLEGYSEEDAVRDKAIVYLRMAMDVGRLYAPAVLIGISSIAALTGSHIILSRRNVATAAAYAALDRGFREYRDRVREALGAEEEAKLRYGGDDVTVVEETDEGPVTKTVKRASKGSIYARIFDEGSANWSRDPGYNQMFVRCQQNYANDLLQARGHVFLNEIYDALGLPRCKEGAVVGWLRNGSGDGHIDFGVFEGDTWSAIRFINGEERSILLDFNVDGVIYDKI